MVNNGFSGCSATWELARDKTPSRANSTDRESLQGVRCNESLMTAPPPHLSKNRLRAGAWLLPAIITVTRSGSVRQRHIRARQVEAGERSVGGLACEAIQRTSWALRPEISRSSSVRMSEATQIDCVFKCMAMHPHPHSPHTKTKTGLGRRPLPFGNSLT